MLKLQTLGDIAVNAAQGKYQISCTHYHLGPQELTIQVV
jgi:hypothetical protein